MWQVAYAKMGVSLLTKNNTKKILLKINFIFFLFKLTKLVKLTKASQDNYKNSKNRRNKPNVQHPQPLNRAHSNQKHTKEHKKTCLYAHKKAHPLNA